MTMKIPGKSVVTCIALICGLYLYFALLIDLTCKDILCFKEGVAVLVSDSSQLQSMAAWPGGISEICALWLTQWFTSPMAAVWVGAALFTLIAMLTVMIARRMGCGLWQIPLMAVPASALVLMSCNIDYNLSGTVAYAFMLMGILPLTCIKSTTWRFAVAVVNCVLLPWIGGAITMLYAFVAICLALSRDLRRVWMWALLPIVAFLWGKYAVYSGYYSTLAQALLPYSFYTSWSAPGHVALLPWALTIAVIAAGALLLLLRMPKGGLYQGAIGVSVLAIVVIVGARTACDDERNAFARLSYLSREHDWNQILKEYTEMPQDNLTLQNIANLALAEKDMLNDVLFHHQCSGVASLHNSGERSPYNYMTLSDVYYSMGLIALAQKYAFEANEAFGNFSPRMLMRLVDTNLITGNHDVALKYIALLEHTSRYSSWAKQRRSIADGTASFDSALESKRKCLFLDDRFAGYVGFGDDMLQALRANSAHSTTLQYLCAYYMLEKNVPALISVVEEFHGSPALRIPLPEHLQEAVVIDAIVSGSGIDEKYQIHPSVMQRCKAFWADHQPQPATLWHYLRNSR